ncbi:MAG: dihydropteroate synthase [Desulfobacterium sp.]|nr:dihydropteroate synthase [Desulfobacterium sp.]
MIGKPYFQFKWGGHSLDMGQTTLIMGIVNITPDSFSDGGRFIDPHTALSHAEKMVEAGADIVDIGGESTRPFSDPVSEEEEIKRVIPVISALAKHVSIPISIDTTKARVARKALDAGASIINDISALRQDPGMAMVVAESKVPVILMHMLGTPKNMQESPTYQNVVGEIRAFLKKAIHSAIDKGIDGSRIIIDPGIGFGKTVDHNFQLLKHIHEFLDLKVPVLVGPSRKAFIRNKLSEIENKTPLPDSLLVETGTQAAVAACALSGVHIVRCHNVANTRATLKIIDEIRNASTG